MKDAQNLGDNGTTENGQFVPNWIPAFKQQQIHGVVIISGDCELTVSASQALVEGIFNIGAHNATMHEILTIKGKVRPGDEKGHEQ